MAHKQFETWTLVLYYNDSHIQQIYAFLMTSVLLFYLNSSFKQSLPNSKSWQTLHGTVTFSDTMTALLESDEQLLVVWLADGSLTRPAASHHATVCCVKLVEGDLGTLGLGAGRSYPHALRALVSRGRGAVLKAVEGVVPHPRRCLGLLRTRRNASAAL